MNTTSFYDESELSHIGFYEIGENVLVSRHAKFYGSERISLGNNVRIDDFCIISAGKGGIEIGNNVHIASYTSLIGEGKIVLMDFSGTSSRVSIYSSNDDYSGESLSNPTIPRKFKNVENANVIISKHVIIGSGSIVLPGVTINEGAAIGALSLVNKDCEAFYIYTGNPAIKLCKRKHDLLKLEEEFTQIQCNGHKIKIF